MPDIIDDKWPHNCKNCQAQYSPDTWETTKYVGVSTTLSSNVELEFRICSACGASMKKMCPAIFVEIDDKS